MESRDEPRGLGKNPKQKKDFQKLAADTVLAAAGADTKVLSRNAKAVFIITI
jgi:hypothetical protein